MAEGGNVGVFRWLQNKLIPGYKNITQRKSEHKGTHTISLSNIKMKEITD